MPTKLTKKTKKRSKKEDKTKKIKKDKKTKYNNLETPMSKIIYEKESYKIIGCCFEVYKDKGCGFTEPVYQECLEIEFEHQEIPFVSQPEIQLEYRDKLLKQYFKPDFICFGKIILEIKAVSKLIDEHRSQTLNYLNATNFDLALLVNFGHHPLIEKERIGNRKDYKSIRNELNNLTENN